MRIYPWKRERRPLRPNKAPLRAILETSPEIRVVSCPPVPPFLCCDAQGGLCCTFLCGKYHEEHASHSKASMSPTPHPLRVASRVYHRHPFRMSMGRGCLQTRSPWKCWSCIGMESIQRPCAGIQSIQGVLWRAFGVSLVSVLLFFFN